MTVIINILWEGITFAILFLSGKIPSLNEELQILLNVVEMSLLTNFKILVGIEVGPEDFLSSSLVIIMYYYIHVR